MEFSDDLEDRIDSYVQNLMTSSHKEAFEKELNADAVLKAEVNMRLALRDLLVSSEIEKKLNDIRLNSKYSIEDNTVLQIDTSLVSEPEANFSLDEKARVIKINWVRYFSLAASLALIWLVWQPTKLSNDKLVEYAYTSVHADLQTLSEQATTEQLQGRSGTRDFGDIRDYELGIKAFEEGEYGEAEARLKSIVNNAESTQNIDLVNLISLCQLKQNKPNAVLKNELLQYENDVQSTGAFNYNKLLKSIALLQLGETKKAKILLKEIANCNCEVAPKAKGILSKIRFSVF